jgi:signal transduction histidine kinase
LNEIPGELNVYADEKMVNSLLRNLLSNAIKFTGKNGMVIGRARERADWMTEISITDTGVGMPAEIVEKLFKLGEKVSTRGTENEPSTGLGLLLCKEFVDKHGGTIWAESVEEDPSSGKPGGSTFYFTLPVHETILPGNSGNEG